MAGIRGVKGGHSVSQPVTLQVPTPEVEQTPVSDPAVTLMPAGLPPDLPAQALKTAMEALGISEVDLAAVAASMASGGITAGELATGELVDGPADSIPPEDSSVTSDPVMGQLQDAMASLPDDVTNALAQLISVTAQLVEAVRTIGTQQQWMTDRMVGMGEMFATAAPILGGGGNPLSMLKKLATAMAAAGGRKEIEGQANGG